MGTMTIETFKRKYFSKKPVAKKKRATKKRIKKPIPVKEKSWIDEIIFGK